MRFLFIFVVAALLSACATKPKPTFADALFDSHVDRILSGDRPPSYQAALNAYLQSSQVQNTGPKYQEYEHLNSLVEAGKLACTDVDWSTLTSRNFWSLKPHISAAACYESSGNSAMAERHNRAIDFLLTGIMASGDGEAYYSAYEIMSLGDANDVIELMGYEVIDFYGELMSSRRAFYYVVVANDPKTGKQHEIYFDNQRFVHAVMGEVYPFIGLDDGWKTRVLPAIAGFDRAIKVPLASAEAADGNLDQAYQLYMEAIADGSLRARYRLALLAIDKKLPQVSSPQAVQLLMEAAEQQYVPAIVVLAYLYDKGIAVEQDKILASELLESVGTRKSPGYAHYLLANHFKYGLLASADENAAEHYFALAESAGSVDAKLARFLSAVDKDNFRDNAALSELKTLAEQGAKWANYLVGEWLLIDAKSGSNEAKEAEQWLKKAAAFGIPDAHYRLGRGYQRGTFGSKDEVKALSHYSEGAMRFHSDSMLNVGYYNDMGIAVYVNKRLAARWYMLCSMIGNIQCTYNTGHMFEAGEGVRQDYQAARVFFEAASKENHSGAFNSLGLLYLDGKGLEKNPVRAMELFQKAADLGYHYGDYNLGRIYFEGQIVPRDLVKARAHFVRAAAKNHEIAKAKIEEIDALLKGSTSH